VITHSDDVARAARRRITLRDGLVSHDTGSDA
jgi:putative ABC transport system ATP-binding protein